MKQEERAAHIIEGSLIAGVLIGCMLFWGVYLCQQHFLMDAGLEDFAMDMTVNQGNLQYFLYLICKRLIQALLYIVLLLGFNYMVATCSYGVLCGGYFGLVACDLFFKFGSKGLVYVLLCFFPHYLGYWLSVFCYGCWFSGNFISVKSYSYVKEFFTLVKIFVIILLIGLSLFWEIRFQKNFFGKIYQYLVE